MRRYNLILIFWLLFELWSIFLFICPIDVCINCVDCILFCVFIISISFLSKYLFFFFCVFHNGKRKLKITFTESGDKRSSSEVVEDDTGDDNDDFVGRPIRFFVVVVDDCGEDEVVDDEPWPGIPIELLLLL